MVTMSIPRTPLTILVEFFNWKRPVLLISIMVAALLPAKSQRFLIEFPGPKIQLRQQLMASPGYSRLVTWVTVGVVYK